VKKELNGGVVVGVVIVVVLAAGALLWKAIAPPAPAAMKSFDKASLKVMQQKHSESADEIRKEQMQALQQSQGGAK
jgi:hypothetical protein